MTGGRRRFRRILILLGSPRILWHRSSLHAEEEYHQTQIAEHSKRNDPFHKRIGNQYLHVVRNVAILRYKAPTAFAVFLV